MKNEREARMRQSGKGFTLVELLVVMAIITVLGALVASGIMGWLSGQARRNTETQIRWAYNALLQHRKEVIENARKENIPATVLTFSDNNPERARVIWIKIRLMEAFPVRFSEITNAYTTPPLSYVPAGSRLNMPNYKAILATRTAANTQSKTESAACLYMALSMARGNVNFNKDTLAPYVKDMDNDGLPEFVDGWQEPLYVYRFSTGNAELQAMRPAGMQANNFDPLDPRGTLRNWSSANATVFDNSIHQRSNGVDAWYAMPTIVSSGPNLKLGLAANLSAPFGDLSVATPIDADDNVYSHKLK